MSKRVTLPDMTVDFDALEMKVTRIQGTTCTVEVTLMLGGEPAYLFEEKRVDEGESLVFRGNMPMSLTITQI